MLLIPAFKIGVWNAWIFMLYELLPVPLFTLTALRKRAPSAPDISALKTTDRKIFLYSKVIMFLPIIYSIFLPLQLGTVWFYIGLPTALIGLALFTIVWVNLATSSIDKEPAIKGLYRYSRHPMYITGFLADIGVGIACASWLFLLLTIVSIILTLYLVDIEERSLLEQYGNAYHDYINRTPRWLGTPKPV
jgi:protein-S-isoprenylcysteine O-methyltransferase Ste14